MNRLVLAVIGAFGALALVAFFSGSEDVPTVSASVQTSPPRAPVASVPSDPNDIDGGVLRGTDADGTVMQFPLERTDVHAEVTGNIAQVELTQIFRNPYEKKIEAVYVFPLPNRAAVNGMEIQIGDRRIEAVIKKRDDARHIYEQARAAGHVTALLDQERPNIFTQSVANILPGNSVEVIIRYFETVPYEKGSYSFSFPMVVGPRFIPGAPTSAGERGWSANTGAVPDASRITPPVLKPGQRSGHDISVSVRLNAGAPIANLTAPSHDVVVEREGRTMADVHLADEAVIPNKDFVLRYGIDGDAPSVALLPHRQDGDGYFLLLVQPDATPNQSDIRPKEMIFVVDGSGSMSGQPIEKVKEAMRHALRNLNPGDTFQILRFANRVEKFAAAPVSANATNVEKGLAYVASLSGRGGTIMLEGVREALQPSDDPERLRIISFMTDGYIGNEHQILAYLKNNLGDARLFSFGVGNAVNRYLLDKMAEFGRGSVEYVLLGDRAGASIERFYERIRNPYLTDVDIDWGGIPVEDVYPKTIPDLFLGQPIVVHGRYRAPGKGTIRVQGRLGTEPYEQAVEVLMPDEHPEGDAIGTLWARARIEDLSNEDISSREARYQSEITEVALAHNLVSAFTSFVAVEKSFTTGTDEPELVEVPVTMPDGVSYQGVFGGVPGGVIGGIVGGVPSNAETISPGAVIGFGGGRYRAQAQSSRRSEARSLRAPQAELDASSTMPPSVRIAATRSTFRVGEPIEISVAFTNLGRAPIDVPAALDAARGTVRFEIIDGDWNVLPHPTRAVTKPALVSLAPGDTATLRIVLNASGAYDLRRAGRYHIILSGGSFGLPDSNRLTIRIR